MLITFLGTRGSIKNNQRNCASLLITQGSQKILLDYGSNELPEDITAILVTHGHPNHIRGLEGKNLSVPVYLNKFSHEQMTMEKFPFYRRLFWKKPFSLGDIRITPVPVLHSIESPANGFVLEGNNRKLAYFSDVLFLKNHPDILRHVDVYIGDGTSLDETQETIKQGKKVGHASVRAQLQWCRNANVKRAIFTHLGLWALNQSRATLMGVAEALSKEFNIAVTFAHDGYRLHMGEKISLQETFSGVHFLSPHAVQVAEGYQTMIVSLEPLPEGFSDIPLYFFQENKVYGTLKITKSHGPRDSKSMRDLKDRHLITNMEWSALYGTNKVYFHDFVLIEVFRPPKEISPIKSPTRWMQSVQLQERSINVKEEQKELGEFGRKVTLEEVLSNWDEPIVLKEGFITVTDEIANVGETNGCVNIFQTNSKEVPSRDQSILLRLEQALSPDVILHRDYTGEYNKVPTPYVKVFDLVLIPSRDRHLQRVESLPYVLTKRAVDKKWVPPFDVSCLPRDIQMSIPSTFIYWVKKDLTERLRVRNELVDAIHRGEVKISRED